MKKNAQTPLHIAIIPDGNRRWSRSNRLNLRKGYSMGIGKVIDVCTWAKKQGVDTISVWALSTENITQRSKAEIGLLYKLYIKSANDQKILELLEKNGARVNIIGNMSILPKRLKDALLKLQNQTRMYKELTVNLLVGYGGKDDIAYAVRSISAERPKHIDSEAIKSRLMTADVPDVDLIIRTSGEKRLSGLLPWQSNYSELYFARKTWPDFGREDLKRAIDTFHRRQRRFGK
ncbi:MAG TPA: polyprenyl diphosphate synthase [Candidatus Acidoferrum sp.]|nr:polyprenyl diphosphate synthase [Candidatus Acidoferrum sp.]